MHPLAGGGPVFGSRATRTNVYSFVTSSDTGAVVFRGLRSLRVAAHSGMSLVYFAARVNCSFPRKVCFLHTFFCLHHDWCISKYTEKIIKKICNMRAVPIKFCCVNTAYCDKVQLTTNGMCVCCSFASYGSKPSLALNAALKYRVCRLRNWCNLPVRSVHAMR